MSTGGRARGSCESKVPGARSETWMATLATLLLVGGAALGIGMLAAQGAADVILFLDARKLLRMIVGMVAITIVTLVVHEAMHGVGMLLCGARPRFGVGLVPMGLPYLYTTSDGHRFTRRQYITIAAAPNVLINLALLLLIAWGPHAAWWVVPLAVHLSGGVGDVWLCWAALTEPAGTLVEDQREGVRVYRPQDEPPRRWRRPQRAA